MASQRWNQETHLLCSLGRLFTSQQCQQISSLGENKSGSEKIIRNTPSQKRYSTVVQYDYNWHDLALYFCKPAHRLHIFFAITCKVLLGDSILLDTVAGLNSVNSKSIPVGVDKTDYVTTITNRKPQSCYCRKQLAFMCTYWQLTGTCLVWNSQKSLRGRIALISVYQLWHMWDTHIRKKSSLGIRSQWRPLFRWHQ